MKRNVLLILLALLMSSSLCGGDTKSTLQTLGTELKGFGAFLKAGAPGFGAAVAGVVLIPKVGVVGLGVGAMGLLYGVSKAFAKLVEIVEDKGRREPDKKLLLGTNTILIYKNKDINEGDLNQYMSKHSRFLSVLLPKLGMHKNVHLFIGNKQAEGISGGSYLNAKGEPCIEIGAHTLVYSDLDTHCLWAHECAHLLLGHCAGGPRVGLYEYIKALYNQETFKPYYERIRAQEMDADLYTVALLGSTKAAFSYNEGDSQMAQKVTEQMQQELGSCSLVFWPWYRMRNKFFPLEHIHPEAQQVRAELKKWDKNRANFIKAFPK